MAAPKGLSASEFNRQQMEILSAAFGHLLDEAGLSSEVIDEAGKAELQEIERRLAAEVASGDTFGTIGVAITSEGGIAASRLEDAQMVLTARPLILKRLHEVRTRIRLGGADEEHHETTRPVRAVFVHGLGSTSEGTWTGNPTLPSIAGEVLRSEPLFFDYPTKKLRWNPFRAPEPRIQVIAAGLQSTLDLLAGEDDVVLICHSMGGLIAKKMLVDAERSGIRTSVRKLLLFGTPNNGAELAETARLVSLKNQQLRQLDPESEFVEQLNRDWRALDIASRVETHYIVGAKDRAVSVRSARGEWDARNVTTVVDATHSTLVSPADPTDFGALRLRTELELLRQAGAGATPDSKERQLGEDGEVRVASEESHDLEVPQSTASALGARGVGAEELKVSASDLFALAATFGGVFLAGTEALNAINSSADGVTLVLACLLLAAGATIFVFAARNARRGRLVCGGVASASLLGALWIALSASPSMPVAEPPEPTIAAAPSSVPTPVPTTPASPTTSATAQPSPVPSPEVEPSPAQIAPGSGAGGAFVLDDSPTGTYGVPYFEVAGRYVVGVRSVDLIRWGPTNALTHVGTITVSDTRGDTEPVVVQVAPGDQVRFGQNCERLLTVLLSDIFTVTVRVGVVENDSVGCLPSVSATTVPSSSANPQDLADSVLSHDSCDAEAWAIAANALISAEGLAGSWVDPDMDCIHSNYEREASGQPSCTETADCDGDGINDGLDPDYDSGGGRIPSLEEQAPYFAS